jgi:hypothetical protein
LSGNTPASRVRSFSPVLSCRSAEGSEQVEGSEDRRGLEYDGVCGLPAGDGAYLQGVQPVPAAGIRCVGRCGRLAAAGIMRQPTPRIANTRRMNAA